MAKIDKKGRMIAIADYLFANPMKERADILAMYGKKWQMSVRTVDRVIKEAKEYNLERINKQEKAKEELLTEEAKKSIISGIISREESMKILSEIAKGKSEDESNDGNRIKAIQQLAKMSGWETAPKTESTLHIVVGDE